MPARKAARKVSWPKPPRTTVSPPRLHPEQDEKLTHKARGLLSSQGAHDLAERVRVVWNTRLQTTAGTACRTNSTIELNPRLQKFSPQQILRTLKHEAAHLLAHWRSGRRRIQTHGPEWHQACADLGIGDERAYHDLPLPRRKLTRSYAYQCPQCLTIVLRVRPFEPAPACYTCCRKHNAGQYSRLFQFVGVAMPE